MAARSPCGGHRRECGGEVAVDLGDAGELGEELRMVGIPDAGRVVHAADGKEPPVWLQARDKAAVIADRRQVPAEIGRRGIPDPGGTIPGSADHPARVRIEVRDHHDVSRSIEDGDRHSLRGVRDDDRSACTRGEYER